MSQKKPPGRERGSEDLEALWKRLRREAEGLLIAFSREGRSISSPCSRKVFLGERRRDRSAPSAPGDRSPER